MTMGRYGIGARVRDRDGDEGEIVAKRKGEREVSYSEWGFAIWWPKAELTAVGMKLEIGKTYVDRVGGKRGPLVANATGIWSGSHPFTDGERTWRADGSFSASGEADEWDLVAEAATEKPSPEKGDFAFAVGDRVTMKHEVDGKISPLVAKVVLDDGEDFHPLLIEFEGDAGFGHGSDRRQWHVDHDDLRPFRLEAGKTYRTRDGKKVGPMEDEGDIAHDTKDPLLAAVVDGRGRLYRMNGAHLFDESGLDIVGLWIEPAVEPAPTSAPTTLTIEAGKFYRTRDGRKVGPAVAAEFGQPWRLRDDTEGVNRGFYDNGSWYSVESRHDLVAEWVEPEVVKQVPPWSRPEPAAIKAGDVVRVVRGHGELLVAGSEHVVKRVTRDYVYLEHGEREDGWNHNRFEPAAAPQPKFKVGDSVRHIQLGYVGTVKRVVNEEVVETWWPAVGWGANDPVDELELVATEPTPPLLIGQAVVASGYISGANGNNFSVVFGDRSYDLPATSLKKAA